MVTEGATRISGPGSGRRRRETIATPRFRSARPRALAVSEGTQPLARRWARPGSVSLVASPLIDPTVPPSSEGCVECLAAEGWWFHLRRCAACGHIGCCDSSPSQHATAHARATGHWIIRSFEPAEHWYYDYRTERVLEGPPLAAPEHHPLDQPVPGPAGKVPSDWERHLH